MAARKYAQLVAALEKLRDELDSKNISRYSTTFAQVEQWAGEPLPPAAYKHRPWWSNNRNNNNSNRPWERAYFRTENVDMEAQMVVFRKLPLPQPPKTTGSFRRFLQPKPTETGMSDVARPYIAQQQPPKAQAHTTHHPLRGALKGTIRVTVDVDLTLPADPDWGANL